MPTNRLPKIIVAGIILLGVLVASVFGYRYFTSTKQDVTRQQEVEVKTLTKELNSSSRKIKSKIPFTKKPEIESIVSVAEKRKEKMVDLARKNPQAFLDNSLSEKEKEQIPQEVKDLGLIEEDVSKEGVIQVTQIDNFDQKVSSLDYAIREGTDEDGYYSVHFASAPPENVFTGAQAIVRGIGIGKEIVLSNAEEESINITSSVQTAIPEIQKEEKIAVIMFNFLNDKTQPMTADELRQGFFTDPKSANAFFQENSYGKISLTGDVFGPFTIPYNKEEGDCSEYDNWALAAESVAFASGVDITQYPKRAFSFPTPDNCHGGAWANLGGNPSRMWIPGRHSMFVISHEFGHNLNQHHANFFSCNQGETHQLSCNKVEYGDNTDVMGSYDAYFHYNAPHKIDVGWLAGEQIIEATESGTYTIYPLENADPLPKVIKVTISNDSKEYYIGYRQPVGFDSRLGNIVIVNPDGSTTNNTTEGVQIHAWDSNTISAAKTYLLDANFTSTDTNSNVYTSSLTDGGTYTDTENNISIKQISHDENSATVEIVIDETVCQRNAPRLEITPTSQGVSVGGFATYNISVTNLDNANCSPSTFFINSQWSRNYQATIVPQRVDLNPQESFDSIINLTSISGPLGPKPVMIYVYGYFGQHTANVEIEYVLQGTINNVSVQPNPVSVDKDSEATIFTAHAFDTNNREIWTGITYEWELVSHRSIGTLLSDINVATFTPTGPGLGEILVTGIYSDGNVATGSASIAVTGEDKFACETDNDCGCALDIDTNKCAIQNTNYLTGRCVMPDYCSGFSGRCLPKCVQQQCVFSCPKTSPTPISEPDATSAPPPDRLPSSLIGNGDTNNDGVVDTKDINAVILNFGRDPSVADLDNNGIVDIFDYNIVVRNFGNRN